MLFLWRPLFKLSGAKNIDNITYTRKLAGRFALSMVVNIAIIFGLYFLRPYLPLDFVPLALSTVVTLTIITFSFLGLKLRKIKQ